MATAAKDFIVLLLERVIIGVGVGTEAMTIPIYISKVFHSRRSLEYLPFTQHPFHNKNTMKWYN